MGGDAGFRAKDRRAAWLPMHLQTHRASVLRKATFSWFIDKIQHNLASEGMKRNKNLPDLVSKL